MRPQKSWNQELYPKESQALKDRLADLYANDSAVKELAERIHERRMMPPPACEECILVAAINLSKLHEPS